MRASGEQQAPDAHYRLLKALHSVSEEQEKTYMDSWQYEEAQKHSDVDVSSAKLKPMVSDEGLRSQSESLCWGGEWR